MKRASHCGPALAGRAESQTGGWYSVSPPDEQGNRFITVLDDEGRPLPPNEPSDHDREGA